MPSDEDIRKAVLKAVLKLKNKAPGDSDLTPQMWKAIAKDDNTFEILKTIVRISG